ncbi:MAG: type 1 glutamine amidotransferase [Acidobacteriota bacterium]
MSAVSAPPEERATTTIAEPLRVGLIQIRSHPDTEHHEQQCIIDQLGIDRSQLVCVNVVHKADIAWRDISSADLLVIGGSGDHTVTRDYDFTPHLTSTVQRAVSEDMPTFGICWGHHFLARALGGEVRTDPLREEVGTFDVTVNEAGRQDPLFGNLPERFPTNLVHHDAVITLPPGAIELGRSERCRNQILRLEDKLVYGTQFHCEMDADALRSRLGMYAWEYVDDAAELEEVHASVSDTPDAATLLPRFVELVVKGGPRQAGPRQAGPRQAGPHAAAPRTVAPVAT